MTQPIKEGSERSLVAIILKELGVDIKVVHPTLRVDVHAERTNHSLMVIAQGKNKITVAGHITDAYLKVQQRDVYIRGNKIRSDDSHFRPGQLRLHPSLGTFAEFELTMPDSIDNLFEWVMARVDTYVINPYNWREPFDASPQSPSECTGDSL